MAFCVNEDGGNFSGLTWYRTDGYSLNMSSAAATIGAAKYTVFTPLNSGNARGIILALGGNNQAFESQGSSIGNCTFTAGDPATITLASHGLIDGDLVQFRVSWGSTLPTGITGNYYVNSATQYIPIKNYYVINATTDTFQVSLTLGGAGVATTDAGSGTIVVAKISYLYCILQRGRTATMSSASPTIVTLNSHGFRATKQTCTFSSGYPTVITCAGHGLCDGDVVAFSSSGTLPTGLTGTAVCYVINATTDTFQISASRGGVTKIVTSTGTGTISLWQDTVQFTTTGALYTGPTTNTVYFVDYIDANTFYIRPSPGNSRTNTSGSQSGTHTCWEPQDYTRKHTAEIYSASTVVYNSQFILPFAWSKQAAYNTTANGWRIQLVHSNYTAAGLYSYTDSTATDTTKGTTPQPPFLMWSTTTTSFSNGTDAPVFCAKVTADQNFTFTGTVPIVHYNIVTVQSCAGIICSPQVSSRGYTTDGTGGCMFLCDGSAARTITVDGEVLVGTQTGLYFGTEDTPITYANRLTIYFQTPSYSGSSPYTSLFSDVGTTAQLGGGPTIVMSSEYPSTRYATITQDAAASQAVVNVDDTSVFSVDDYVYLTKQDSDYVSAPNVTRYKIQSIDSGAGTITLTTNITGTRLTGGRVILVDRGYGIILQGRSSSSYSYGFRLNSTTNLFMNGVYNYNVAPLTIYSNVRFWDNDADNRRSGGQYIGNCLAESVASTSNLVKCWGAIMPEREGTLIENCIGVGNASIVYTIYRAAYVATYGMVLISGDIELKNCFVAACNVSPLFNIGTTSATANIHDNIVHNTIYLLYRGGTNLRASDNYGYALSSGVAEVSSYFSKFKNNTYERCNYYSNETSTGLIHVQCVEDSPILINTPLVSSFSPQTDQFADLTVFNIDGDLAATFDDTYLTAMADGGNIRLIRNNKTNGEDYCYNNTGVVGPTTCTVPISGTWTIDTPGTYDTSFEDSTLNFTVAGTYNLVNSVFSGTVTLVNLSGGAVIVQTSFANEYVNSGPDITIELSRSMTVTASEIPAGASVRLINVTQDSEIDVQVNLASPGYEYSFTVSTGGEVDVGDILQLNAFKADGTTYSKYYTSLGLVEESGDWTIIDPWENWDEANALNIDGSEVLDFQTDYENVQIDIVEEPLQTWLGAELVAFLLYKTASEADGMRTFFGALTAQNPARWVIDVDKVDLLLDNLGASSADQTDEVIISRSDLSGIRTIPTTGGGGIGIAIANDVSTLIPSASELSSQVWSNEVEGTLTANNVLRIMLAVLAGKTGIADGEGETHIVTFRDSTDTANIITATVEDNQRTDIEYDLD